MIQVPGMFMIGSAHRNAGKTSLACQIISRFSPDQDIIGIKVTTLNEAEATYHSGEAGSKTGSFFEGPFSLASETERSGNKDTNRLLASGAKRVFWLRVRDSFLQEGLAALMKEIGRNTVSVCESNRLRLVAEPDLFFMVKSENAEEEKPSALEVRRFVDRIVPFDGTSFDIDWNRLCLVEGRWLFREKVNGSPSIKQETQ